MVGGCVVSSAFYYVNVFSCREDTPLEHPTSPARSRPYEPLQPFSAGFSRGFSNKPLTSSRPRSIFEGNLSCVYQLGRWTTARCQSKSACIWLLDRTTHSCSLRLHSLWFACKQDSTQLQLTLNSTCGFRTRDVTFDTASPAQPQLAEAQTDLRIGASSTACLKRSTWRQFITGRMAKGNCAQVHD